MTFEARCRVIKGEGIKVLTRTEMLQRLGCNKSNKKW